MTIASQDDKIPYLLKERGRFYYQRKVPLDVQDAVGFKKWREALGADHMVAVGRLVELKEEHDALLKRLADASARQDYKTQQRRGKEAANAAADAVDDLAFQNWMHRHRVSSVTNSNDEAQGSEVMTEAEANLGLDPVSLEMNAEVLARPWEHVARLVQALERERDGSTPTDDEVAMFAQVTVFLDRPTNQPLPKLTFPPFSAYRDVLRQAGRQAQSAIKFHARFATPMDDDEMHDRLVEILDRHFRTNVTPPTEPEDRDEFDLAKQRLERKIARVARSPDTIKKVAERYYAFAQIRPKTQDKYRRTLQRLIDDVGDLPIAHLTPTVLRDYRDKLTADGLLPASIRAVFTPIIGLTGYAVDEGKLDISPMAGVRLPKEKRSIEESKWLPFDPDEMQRILAAVDLVWSKPLQGLTTERRKGLQMVVKALAFTALRPSELMALRPDQVDNRCIRVEGGKTKSAWRVIPLHPEISDFPAWLQAGGMEAFSNAETGQAQTDPVTPIRHNFARLISSRIAPPITHERKALYSLRATFQNSLRRAGAPMDVRRAILGHVESGAIRHYDDGPEFELLKSWVEKADPRR